MPQEGQEGRWEDTVGSKIMLQLSMYGLGARLFTNVLIVRPGGYIASRGVELQAIDCGIMPGQEHDWSRQFGSPGNIKMRAQSPSVAIVINPRAFRRRGSDRKHLSHGI